MYFQPYKCKKCGFTALEEQEIHNHILSKHEDVMCEGLGSESESSDDSGEDNSNTSSKGLHCKFIKQQIIT